ncbi:hypothetical protein BJV74DRAFT_879688 [Russula compacta]|nr:hypothetical protein BJV74DRAFT_879688 [Russula compacta]
MPPDLEHLCPVLAFAEWNKVSNIREGYIFHKMASGDRISVNNDPMTSEYFLEMFRNNLLETGIDPIPYGTHSFRQGGCQWLASDCRWPICHICEWGGWSTEFSHLTIVKYLISWNDNPTEKSPASKCLQCGRSCHCA